MKRRFLLCLTAAGAAVCLIVLRSAIAAPGETAVKPVDFEQFAEVVSQVGMYWVLANQTVS